MCIFPWSKIKMILIWEFRNLDSPAGIAAKYSCVTLNQKVNHFGFQFPDMPNAAVELDGIINSFLYLKLHDTIFLWFNRYLWNKSCQLALLFRFFSFWLPCFIKIFPPHQSTCRNISTSHCIIRSGCFLGSRSIAFSHDVCTQMVSLKIRKG